MQATRLPAAFGVEIRGVDTSAAQPPEAAAELRDLLTRHQLLVFRTQSLDAEAQVRFASALGEVVDEGGDGKRHVFVSNTRVDAVLKRGRPLLFHSDNVFTPAPLAAVGLYAQRVEGATAPTRFANAQRAQENLPADLRERLAHAHALHLSAFTGGWRRYRDAEVESHHPRAQHPILRVNPRSGRPVLFVSEQQTDRILDWEAAESEAMLSELFSHLYAADNLYSHTWEEGDLCLWDNIALQHGRPELPAGRERTLRRVAIAEAGTRDETAWAKISRRAKT